MGWGVSYFISVSCTNGKTIKSCLHALTETSCFPVYTHLRVKQQIRARDFHHRWVLRKRQVYDSTRSGGNVAVFSQDTKCFRLWTQNAILSVLGAGNCTLLKFPQSTVQLIGQLGCWQAAVVIIYSVSLITTVKWRRNVLLRAAA